MSLELERPCVPAAPASRLEVLLVQPPQRSQAERHARAIPRGIIITSLIPERSRWPSVAATIYSKRFSVRLRGKSRRAVGGWALACGAGVHTCSYGGERRRRWAPRHWQSNV